MENIFRIEAMAYKPILQALLEYKPRGFLPGLTVVKLVTKKMAVAKHCVIIEQGQSKASIEPIRYHHPTS